MYTAAFVVPPAVNEPVLSYAPGSAERAALQRELDAQRDAPLEVHSRVHGEDLRGEAHHDIRAPHDHALRLGTWSEGPRGVMSRAVDAARAAHPAWASMSWQARAAVFVRAAELLATKHRAALNAATMLGQSKTVHQAEIDAACELIDFWRWNVAFAARIYAEQPVSPPGVWNLTDHRPLEGFVLAVTPFNFTSIAANLPTAPALMGNTVVWKPSVGATYSAAFILRILDEAGLPPGVINMVLGDPAALVGEALASEHLAGVHFTGSTDVFNRIVAAVGERVGEGRYRGYPRLVGETGGKDFIFAHPSADVDALAVAIVRGAYEFQGQKCSAASRVYLPRSLYPAVRDRVLGILSEVRVGDITDFRNFMGAVIDRRAYDRLTARVRAALADPGCEVLRHGFADDVGYFIEPTLIRVDDPRHALMRDELFGPIAALWVYDDARLDEALALCDGATPYALTGAFFARDRAAIERAATALRWSAGNFYVNDKPTGAVVGQQPFGGARASGTNDKAGSALNLLRWVSPRTVKETLSPPTDWRYPFMAG